MDSWKNNDHRRITSLILLLYNLKSIPFDKLSQIYKLFPLTLIYLLELRNLDKTFTVF
jgi:hypothetical protein